MNTALKCTKCGQTVRGWLHEGKGSIGTTLMDGATIVATIDNEGKVVCVPMCAIPCRYCSAPIKDKNRASCEKCEGQAHGVFVRKVRM